MKVRALKEILRKFDDNTDIIMSVEVEDGTVNLSGLRDMNLHINTNTAHLDIDGFEFLNDNQHDRVVLHSRQTFDAAYEKNIDYLMAKPNGQVS